MEGRRVLVLERAAEPGGGVHSAALTRPGFVHDVCSSVYPLAIGSPYLATLGLESHGLEWVHPGVPLAHKDMFCRAGRVSSCGSKIRAKLASGFR